MSLLWSQSMAWWNDEREHEYEGDDEYPLRDPEESLKDRGQRYVQQIVDQHGVHPEKAKVALRKVIKHHDEGHLYVSPTDYGFASQADQRDHYSHEMSAKLMDPKSWEGKKPTQVSLKQPIHATQNFIRPQSIAHNLFHPGQKQVWEEDAIGDPDYSPSDNPPDDDYEDYEDGPSPEEQALHGHARFLKRNNGKLELADGHHRVAADIALGKTHTNGVVIHEHELGQGGASKGNDPVAGHRKQMELEIAGEPHREQEYRDYYRKFHGVE